MIRAFHPDDLDAVRDLLMSEGWGPRAHDRARLQRIIASASRAVVAEVDGRVVGFGRSLTDGTSNGYLSMLIVHPDHRRRGIGRSIVVELVGDDPSMTWVLRAGHPGSDAFWSSVGFVRSEIAFERPRTA